MSTNNITIKNNNHEIPIPNSFQNLFRPIKVGSSQLPHRFIMAPLTRCRADLNTNIPNDLMAEYYGQRAPYASLIITEYTTISKNAVTFHTEGGLWSDEHVEGWKKTTKAVHDKGGKIFCQIAHGGRAAHPLNNNGEIPVAPSPIKLNHRAGEFFTPKTGEQPENVVPRELTDEEASSIVNDFKAAAIRAKEAGFDGVEVHAANGYLINQFLCESANKRTYGKYSGETMESRFQFCKDVLDAVISVWGSDRVGIRISPLNSYQDMKHEDPMAFTQFFAKKMDEMKLAYLHVMKADFFGIQREMFSPLPVPITKVLSLQIQELRPRRPKL